MEGEGEKLSYVNVLNCRGLWVAYCDQITYRTKDHSCYLSDLQMYPLNSAKLTDNRCQIHFALGCVGYTWKPFSIQKMVAKLQRKTIIM